MQGARDQVEAEMTYYSTLALWQLCIARRVRSGIYLGPNI